VLEPAIQLDLRVRTGGGGRPSGHVMLRDRHEQVVLRQARVTSLIVVGGRATVRGSGLVDRRPVTFRIDVEDAGSTGIDEVSVALSNGYTASGPLRSGDIFVTCR
jgi:hypothetical protein